MSLSETRKRKQSAKWTRHLMCQFWEAGREENRATLSGRPRHFICQITPRLAGAARPRHVVRLQGLGRMPSSLDPVASHRHRDKIVQLQRYHRGTTRRGPPQNHYTVRTPLKVPSPALAPRMKQADTPPGQRIAPMGLLTFEQIACPTGQPEVVLSIGATARPGRDMVDFEWPRHIRLRRETIAAPVGCCTADSRAESGGEGGRH